MTAVFGGLDLTVLIVYILGVTAFGTWLGTRQKDARDYFLADRSIPWWAVCFSVVATETSALTFISVPATAYSTGMWMLQLTIGYLLGRLVVSAVLLPAYFRGELTTAYMLLQQRFGLGTRRFASIIFMVTRALADGVRIFATAIPIKLITGLPYWQAIAMTGAFTLVYTYFGGLSAVVWVDVVQMFIYIFGGLAALYLLMQLNEPATPAIAAGVEERLRIIHLDGGFSSGTWILTGLIGGAFLSMASHGVDHIIVQRLLASKSLRDARKALITSGFIVIGQFAIFLLVGVMLYQFYEGRQFGSPDEIFPRFIVDQMPAGIRGLVIAGILAAAMSTVASSLNSLASATTHDIYAPLAKVTDDVKLMKMGKRFTLMWGVILIGGAMLFQFVQQGTPVVVIALEIASFTYGGLLGGFMLGVLSKRADQTDAIIGMGTAILAMATLWAVQKFGGIDPIVNGLWFALIGSVITLAVGTLSAMIRGSRSAGSIA